MDQNGGQVAAPTRHTRFAHQHKQVPAQPGFRSLDSSVVSQDILADDIEQRSRSDRPSHCWLYSALFLFFIIIGTILIVHFRDQISSGGGSSLQPIDSEPKVYYFNVESGRMKGKTKHLPPHEMQLLNALAQNNTDSLQLMMSMKNQNTSRLETALGDSPAGAEPIDMKAAVIKFLPQIVQILGGPKAVPIETLCWLLSTVELKPLIAKYIGMDTVDAIIDILSGKSSDPALLAAGDGPDAIFPLGDFLIRPETAAELQGLLYS